MGIYKSKIILGIGIFLLLSTISPCFANYGFYIIPTDVYQVNQYNHEIKVEDQINHEKVNLNFKDKTLSAIKEGDVVISNSQKLKVTRLEKEQDYYLLELDSLKSENKPTKSIWQFPYG